MTTPRMRVKAPKNAIKGEIVEIMTLISHPMDTGLRKDKHGIIIPRKIVNKFVCKFNDTEVFVADLHEAISANPLIQFSLVANDSGILKFIWFEDGGKVYSTTRKLRVS